MQKYYASQAWIRQYKSQKTNLTIALVETESPIVVGKFVLVTEDYTDDGTPHALEHLIFQGRQVQHIKRTLLIKLQKNFVILFFFSNNWPYKEVLDSLAGKSFAPGLNAVTRQDSTWYWLDNAGAEGFLNMLPVYLDHIFFPKLEDTAFITEVHHIDGSGNDAGTVYSEMQVKSSTQMKESPTNDKH